MAKNVPKFDLTPTGPRLNIADTFTNVPSNRPYHAKNRMDTKPNVPNFDITPSGSHLNIGKTFPNVVQNGPHHLDANAYGKLPLTLQTPPGAGGGLQYRHDSGHSGSVNIDYVKNMRTTVQAQANARLYQSRDGSAQLNLSGGATKHFTPQGSSQTQGYGMLGFNKKF